MDPLAARQRLETYLDLFLHTGWRQLQQDLDEYHETLADINSVESLEDLYFRKGQIYFVRYLSGLEEAIRRELDQMEAEPIHEEDF